MARSINTTLSDLNIRIYVDKKQEARARRLIESMPDIYNRTFKKVSRDFGTRLLRLVRRCLSTGTPPNGVSWPPHSKSTVHDLGAHPLLNYTGAYKDSIGIISTASRTWVGVGYNRFGGTRNRNTRAVAGMSRQRPGLSSNSTLTLNQIAIIHEYGSKDGRIPPRPLWKPAWKSLGGNSKYQRALRDELRKELRKYM